MRWDVLIPIFLALIATFAIGIVLHRHMKVKNANFQEDYFIGGRSLGPFVLTFTILASAASAGTFIGSPGVAYSSGFSWILILLTQVGMGVYILGILGKKFAIVARKINAVTLTDFFKERYQSKTVVLGSSIGIIIFISAYMVAQFVGGARILESITGLPYKTGLIIFGLAVVLYTVYGGFRAVAITDAIQGIIMIFGGVLLWIFFLVKTEGFSGLIGQIVTEHPELVELPGPSGATPLMLFSYFMLFGIAAIGLPHASVRGMTFKNTESMHKSIIYSGFIMALFSIFFATLGPFVRVLYPNISTPDMALPTLILDIMPGWVAGLVLSAPLAAIMSTVNSMLLVTSSSVVKDIYLNYINPRASERKIAKLSYFSTLIIGVGVVLFALTPPDYLQFLVIYAIGGLEATFFAPIVFGLYWKRANTWGAIVSMYSGLISYIILGEFFPNPFGMQTIVTATAISIVMMIVFSYLTPRPSHQIINNFWGSQKSKASNLKHHSIG
ncbi:MAG TPA: sodium/pantothenate symporter [Bacillus sp. (in: firmicutes)]|uniref:sodium/pantothenate symporter n=1 Tax=Bacillus litorisediminis TaxID=2922713 RepID=UPI001FAC575E|nr:sodium/pantothenate symporter [Bacillus litorisediminis]HWO78467.1 sodium/pantothenate symporter [Bacillus sp. (in: firmicutes)]